jgi:ABC-2 type transport system permease protein
MIYFARFRDLAGWQQQDVALLYGMAAWAFGLSVALAGGFRDMGRAIADGGLDVHLGRPRHPLPSLLLSRSIPSGFGDIASAPVMWLFLGGRSIADLPLLIALASAGAVVMLATFVMGQCLVFWWPRAVRLGEELVNVVLMISVYPQHVFGAGMRIVLFTVLPVGFISQLPVEAIREADWAKAAAVLAAACIYGFLAVFVFEQGLRRYASGNRMVVNR